MYFDTSILCLRHAILFQRLLLLVGDWYEQCGCVVAWRLSAEKGVARRIEVAKGKYLRTRVCFTTKTMDLKCPYGQKVVLGFHYLCNI